MFKIKNKKILTALLSLTLLAPMVEVIQSHEVHAATAKKQAPYISKDLLQLANQGKLKGTSSVYKIGTPYKTVKKYLKGKTIFGAEHINGVTVGSVMIGFASRDFEKIYDNDKIINISIDKPYLSEAAVKKALGKPYEVSDSGTNNYRLIYTAGKQYLFIDAMQGKSLSIQVIEKKSWDDIPG